MPHRTVHLLWLLLLFCLLSAVAYLLQLTGVPVVHPYIYYIFLFLFALSVCSSFVTDHALQWEGQKFVTAYMASMVLRLLLSFGAAVVVLFQDLPEKMVFMLNFAAAYLIFLVFEICTLLTTLRANSEKGAEHAN